MLKAKLKGALPEHLYVPFHLRLAQILKFHVHKDAWEEKRIIAFSQSGPKRIYIIIHYFWNEFPSKRIEIPNIFWHLLWIAICHNYLSSYWRASSYCISYWIFFFFAFTDFNSIFCFGFVSFLWMTCWIN